MVTLRVVNWNMAHRAENWDQLGLLLGSGPAIGLVQEAPDPAHRSSIQDLSLMPGGVEPQPWSTLAGNSRSWSTAVVATSDVACRQAPRVVIGDATGEHLAMSHPGAYAAARVSIPGHHEVGVVSMYGVWDRQEGIGSYSEATLHRTISDLTPWLHRPPVGGLIIAGDFNCYLDYGDWWDGRYMTVFNRLAAYGLDLLGPKGREPLDGCPCRLGPDCRHIQTYAHRHASDSKPFQLDFAFGNEPIVDRVVDCAVAPEATFEASDHLPVVTTLHWSDE
jgi:hypothetical protein